MKPCHFPTFIFFSTKLSSFCVHCPGSMTCWLLIIQGIDSSVPFGGFPSKFSKCCFHSCIHSSLLAAFILALAVPFLLLTSFNVCHAILDYLSSTDSLILLIWFCVSSVCSLRYALVHLILVGFLQLHRDAVFTSARFFSNR